MVASSCAALNLGCARRSQRCALCRDGSKGRASQEQIELLEVQVDSVLFLGLGLVLVQI